MSALAIVAALLVSAPVFLAGLILLAVFVQKAAHALMAVGDLREHTSERDKRRATVEAAREAVEDVRAYGETYGRPADADIQEALRVEAAMNGRPYRTTDNEHRNHAEEEELEDPSVPPDSFFVHTAEQ